LRDGLGVPGLLEPQALKVPLAADGYRELGWLMNGASEGLAEAEADHVMRVTVSAVWQLALQRQTRR
jgi:hypothetical protein